MARTKISGKRSWCPDLSIAGIAAITIPTVVSFIAIIVILAVVLPRRGHHGHKTSILLPLYIYPSNSTSWGPLYNALNARPDLNFTVIVNPRNGPGSSQYPNDHYTTELKKLNAYPNVETVGYVRTGYATRTITAVVSEVSTYAGWASNHTSLAMHGIFFDEAPYDYSAAAVEYMQNINRAVKHSTGLKGDRTIIHNPGVVPDSRYNDPSTDITVVLEDSYLKYQAEVASLADLPNQRSEYSLMINSVPGMDRTTLTKFVHQLSKRAGFLTITNNDQDFYASFGTLWAKFTDVVPT